MSDLRAQCLSVLDLTRAILAAAAAGEWDEVSAREAQRQVALERIFAAEVAGEADAFLLADMIEQVREMDKAICETACRERDAIAAELNRLRRGQRQRQAYLDVADAGV
ncbi:MAG TPA: flagellar protein FliT [Methylococcaceae bacterium]|nr:flagellar protein FliT [Methylococcaceae bacterium]